MFRLYKNIAVVDDNKDDIVLLKQAFRENELIHKIRAFKDPVQFLNYTIHSSSFSLIWEMPDVILLDMDMHSLNGIDLTRELRADPKFRDIPVVMLSRTSTQLDVLESYNAGITLFFRKPSRYSEWLDIAKTIDELWCTCE
jgi:two-component system, response regulator